MISLAASRGPHETASACLAVRSRLHGICRGQPSASLRPAGRLAVIAECESVCNNLHMFAEKMLFNERIDMDLIIINIQLEKVYWFSVFCF